MSTRYSNRDTDDERMDRGSRGAPLLAGLMIGGLLGASAMLLLAPQAGRQTRQELQQGAMALKDRTSDNVRGAMEGAKSKAADLQNQGKDIAIEQLDRVANAAQQSKKSLQSSRNQSS
jgi:gas vesicle protein